MPSVTPRRVLPIEFFRGYKVLALDTDGRLLTASKVFQEFIQDEFRINRLPGSTWVEGGSYQLIDLLNNRALDEQNWRSSVASGTSIAMSMGGPHNFAVI